MSEQNNHNKKEPIEVLEGKARYLEVTLEKMQKHSNVLYHKIKRLKYKNPKKVNIKKLEENLKDINRGIEEVFEKCDVLWKKIAVQYKEEKTNR
jgi:uncharacterized protein YoxC